jgi:uncharacterized metal-binding protein
VSVSDEPIKVGIISCAGEEIPEGTISRLAVRRVLERLRPGQAVTLCLPLFLAGDNGEREFARNYPTITVDGCDKRCAKWGTEKHSGPVNAALVVADMLKEAGVSLSGARSVRRLTKADLAAVDMVAESIAKALDKVAVECGERRSGTAESSTSCATALPAGTLQVNGELVRVTGLPLIFKQCQEDGLKADDPEASARLLEVVRVYHTIEDREGKAYAAALCEAYAAFLRSGRA